jgi:hypothetical protein
MLEILVVRGVCRAINTVAFAPPRSRREICWSDCGSEAKSHLFPRLTAVQQGFATPLLFG